MPKKVRSKLSILTGKIWSALIRCFQAEKNFKEVVPCGIVLQYKEKRKSLFTAKKGLCVFLEDSSVLSSFSQQRPAQH